MTELSVTTKGISAIIHSRSNSNLNVI